MSGSFSSADQATQDPDFLDIILHMVPIWSTKSGGKWLYVEQAQASNEFRPYRQRIYHLLQHGENQFESRIFELPTPHIYAGNWQTPGRFRTLSPKQLIPRRGCSLYIHQEDAIYLGSTQDRACLSQHRGATYATSHVTITPTSLETWDRGYDTDGNQVWGSTKGPYIFKKL